MIHSSGKPEARQQNFAGGNQCPFMELNEKNEAR
jgi:hypothetical protein